MVVGQCIGVFVFKYVINYYVEDNGDQYYLQYYDYGVEVGYGFNVVQVKGCYKGDQCDNKYL